MMNPYDMAAVAAHELKLQSGFDGYDVAVILGSGWKEGAEALGEPESVVTTSSLSGFVAPTVVGHSGKILSVRVGDARVALVSGRVHLYEGHGAATVVHPVRTLIAAGVTKVVLTNACGGLDPQVAPGNVVIIRDHINFTATSPLEGPSPPEGFGPRFVDLTDLYSARLRGVVHDVAPDLTEGVYMGYRGPQYETPAEIAMSRTMGATLVGMSTVLEALAARQLGAEVLGLSLVTNFAAGVTSEPLSHQEVLEAGQAASASLGSLLARVLPAL